MHCKSRTDIYTPLCVKQMASGKLLCSTGAQRGPRGAGWAAWREGAPGERGRGTGEGPCSAVPSLLPPLPAQSLLARAYLHGIYISFASRSIKNLTSSRLPGAACPAW